MIWSGSTTFFFDLDIFSERPTSTGLLSEARTILRHRRCRALDLFGQQPGPVGRAVGLVQTMPWVNRPSNGSSRLVIRTSRMARVQKRE